MYRQHSPVKYTWEEDERPLTAREELVTWACITAGTFLVMWGGWHLWKWFVRALLQ